MSIISTESFSFGNLILMLKCNNKKIDNYSEEYILQIKVNLGRCFIVCLYIYCRWRSSYQEGRVGIQLTCLTLPHFCACPMPRPGFTTSDVMVLFISIELR